MTRRGVFITGTGTGVGKTEVGVRLCVALQAAGERVLALKPVETGVCDVPEDAVRLAEACLEPRLAHAPGFYRAAAPVAPWAATLAGEPSLSLVHVEEAIRSLIESHPDAYPIVEGAGGPLVPLTENSTVADLCRSLELPALVVSRDRLGTLSHTLSACESLRSRGVEVAAVVLNRFGATDVSQRSNFSILEHWLDVPVYRDDMLQPLVSQLLR